MPHTQYRRNGEKLHTTDKAGGDIEGGQSLEVAHGDIILQRDTSVADHLLAGGDALGLGDERLNISDGGGLAELHQVGILGTHEDLHLGGLVCGHFDSTQGDEKEGSYAHEHPTFITIHPPPPPHLRAYAQRDTRTHTHAYAPRAPLYLKAPHVHVEFSGQPENLKTTSSLIPLPLAEIFRTNLD